MSEAVGTRDSSADLIKFVAMCMVVMIHVVAMTLINEEPSEKGWYIANIVDSFCRVAPPLFFMISGAFLLSKSEPILDFFRKRASKLLVPFVFWSGFYLALRLLFGVYLFDIRTLLHDLFFGAIYYHLWFLNTIIVIYIVTPLMRNFVSKRSHASKVIVSIALFAPSWFLCYYFKTDSYITNTLAYIGYFLLGYLLYEQKEKVKNIYLFAFVTYVVISTFTAVSTYELSNLEGGFNGYYYGYSTINVLLASVTCYIFLLGVKIAREAESYLSILSACGLGIYLIHPIFIRLFGVETGSLGTIFQYFVTFVAVFASSFVVVFIIRKNRLLAKLV